MNVTAVYAPEELDANIAMVEELAERLAKGLPVNVAIPLNPTDPVPAKDELFVNGSPSIWIRPDAPVVVTLEN